MILRSIYEAIQDELIDKLKTNFVPPDPLLKKLQHVDLFNDQFNNEEIEKTFRFPAILIEFGDIEWRTESRGIQKGDGLIRFHIGQKTLADSKRGSSSQAKALVILDYLDEVHKAVQGFHGDCFSSLERVSSIQDTNHTNKIVYIMEYAVTILDFSADVKRNLIDAAPVELDVEKNAVIPDPPAQPQPFIVTDIRKC